MKTIRLLFSVFFAMFLGAAVHAETGLNPYLVAGAVFSTGLAVPYLVQGSLSNMTLMAVSPDVALISDYAGEHTGDLFRKMLFGLEAAKHLTILPDVKDETPLLNLKVTKGLRPYNSDTQFESVLTYGQRKLKTGLGKKELEVDPQAYRGAFLSKYMDPSATSKRIPFEQFTNEAVADEFGEEINESVIFYGLHRDRFETFNPASVYAVGDLVRYVTAGVENFYEVVTLTEAGETPITHAAKFEEINSRAVSDGFEILIDEAIDSGELVEVTVGEIDNETVFAVAAFKTVYRSLPNTYRKKTNMAYCSFNTFDLLIDDISEIEKYTVTDPSTNEVMENAVYVPGTNRKLIAQACGWMGESERIICTQKENMIMGCDIISDANQIVTNPTLWKTEMGLLFNPGVNWALSEAVAINDRN